ncbi:crustacean calcium-binding protein 23-like isoform X2 [Convolutriloba macropyga]
MEEQSEREERTEEPPQKAQEDKIRRSKQKELPQQQKPPMEEQSEREERTEEPPQKAQEDKIRRSKQKELPQQQKVMFTANTHMLNQKELREKIKYQLKRSTNPVERIRLTALLRGPGGIRDIGRIFKNMDEDDSGQISFLEFQQGVAEIGCVLDHYELQQAYEAIDTDNSGSISYQEFLVELRDKVMNRIRERMVRDAFSKLDKDGSGCLTMDDLRGVCDVSKHVKIISGEWTEEQALEQFLSYFDTPDNFDGTITKDEFFSYYAGVSASMEEDADFLLMMNEMFHIYPFKKDNALKKVKTAMGMQKTDKVKLHEKCVKVEEHELAKEAAAAAAEKKSHSKKARSTQPKNSAEGKKKSNTSAKKK